MTLTAQRGRVIRHIDKNRNQMKRQAKYQSLDTRRPANTTRYQSRNRDMAAQTRSCIVSKW